VKLTARRRPVSLTVNRLLGRTGVILLLLASACRAPSPVALDRHYEATERLTTLRLLPAAGVRINARLRPVLEQPDGSVLAFSGAAPDSDYFDTPPILALTGPAVGVVHASICLPGERVCRRVDVAAHAGHPPPN